MRYTKKPIARWLEALQSSDDDIRWEAVDAIRHVMEFPGNLDVLLEVSQRDIDHRCRGLALHAFCDYLHNELLDPDAGTETRDALLARGADHIAAAIARDDSGDGVRGQAAEMLRLLGITKEQCRDDVAGL